MTMATQPKPGPRPDDPVEAAIARVLAAEVAARGDIARARDAARQSDEDARTAARALAARNAARIAAIRNAFARHTEAEVGALDREADALATAAPLDAADRERLARALAALAAKLTGAAR
jgi:hypothetical protein